MMPQSLSRRSIMSAILAGTLLSCEPPPQRPRADAEAAPPIVDSAEMPLGQLQVFITDQSSDGRNIHLRGLIRNPYPDTVEGVRVLFRILTEPGLETRELDRFQKTLETQIPSGEKTALRFDVQTMYAGLAGRSGFTLTAFAIRRGGVELPPPPDWRE